jgi:hypothetical protein
MRILFHRDYAFEKNMLWKGRKTMSGKKSYQSLHDNKIFIGGQHDVEALMRDEKCEVIIDLRAEASIGDRETDGIKHIHILLVDQKEGQEQQIQQANQAYYPLIYGFILLGWGAAALFGVRKMKEKQTAGKDSGRLIS